MTKTLSQIRADAREEIFRCKTDERSVLLSIPAQHRCERRGCGNLWVVGDEAPMCKMFDYEKHIQHVIDATFLAIKEAVMVKESIDWGKEHPDDWVDCCGKGEVSGFNACRAEVLRNFDAMEGNERTGIFLSPSRSA